MRAALEVLLVLFSVFVRQKVAITENITLADSVSKIGPPDCSKLAKNPRNDNEVIIFRQTSTSNFFDVLLFLLSNLVTGPSFMSISSLVLELWQFYFTRDWPEIRKSKIPPFEFCPISGDWDKLWIPNLVWVSLIERYWMLQNSRITAFTIFELLRENQLVGGGGVKLLRLGLSDLFSWIKPVRLALTLRSHSMIPP